MTTKSKIYLLTGITGQLGQALCRYIFKKYPESYIIGTTRDLNSEIAIKLQNQYKNLILTLVTPQDKPCIKRLVFLYRPDVIGNLGAQSSVASSFSSPHNTYIDNTEINANLLESVRLAVNNSISYSPVYFNISSSEIYGGSSVDGAEKTELSPISPLNVYAVSKASTHMLVDAYRSIYNLKCFNFVCTNFISEFQNTNFVISKILSYVANIKKQKEKLNLGKIDSVRDWLYVDDVCSAIDICTRNESYDCAGNYNISSYNEYAVVELLKKAFLFENNKNYENYINIDVSNFRLIDTSFCRINSSKIRKIGWAPKYDIDSILKTVIEAKKNANQHTAVST